MKYLLLITLAILLHVGADGQTIKGQIIDSKTNKPLEYVSIGIINTPLGTITNDNGYFEFDYKAQDPSAIARISMIGYESQTFPVAELLKNDTKIKLVETVYEISEVTIKPTKEKTIGAKGYSLLKGWSGWGGMYVRKGYEIGIKIDLGDQSVKIKNLHVMLHRQAFDTCFFRLHIRSLKDTIIQNELLTENIIIPITNESGWADVNLEKYNLIFSGEIGLTLEWLNVKGLNKDRAMVINERMAEAYILLKNNKKNVGLYRWGPEAEWIINKESGPSIYLTVLK